MTLADMTSFCDVNSMCVERTVVSLIIKLVGDTVTAGVIAAINTNDTVITAITALKVMLSRVQIKQIVVFVFNENSKVFAVPEFTAMEET